MQIVLCLQNDMGVLLNFFNYWGDGIYYWCVNSPSDQAHSSLIIAWLSFILRFISSSHLSILVLELWRYTDSVVSSVAGKANCISFSPVFYSGFSHLFSVAYQWLCGYAIVYELTGADEIGSDFQSVQLVCPPGFRLLFISSLALFQAFPRY